MDSKHNIVVNVRITPANVNDAEPVAEILQDIEKRLGKQPKYMGLDAGYHSAPVCHQLAQAGIQPAIGYRRHTHKGDYFGKYRFTYDPIQNVYLCPQGHELTWRTTNREGYREYWSDSRTCRDCPRRAKCFSAKSSRRQVTRHVWQDALEQADAFGKTSSGKRIYAWRKETIERSFAEAKELHGLRYARILGIRTRVNPKFCVNSVWVGIEQSDNRAAADLSGCRLVCIITPVGMDVKGGEAELHPKSWTVVTRQIRTGLGIGQGLTRSLGFHPIVVIVFKISD